jgi:hypothetical protein
MNATFSTAPAQTRAVLITLNDDGSERRQPVAHDASVLNIERELLSHLSAQPLEPEFLERLRDYCAGRLAARSEARAAGGVVAGNDGNRWEVLHVPAYNPVEVR